MSPSLLQSFGAGVLFHYAPTVFVYSITVKTQLNLFPLPACASTGWMLLTDECHRLHMNSCFKRPLMSMGATDIGDDVDALCANWQAEGVYDGWRSPWDQDEIMVCPHAVTKLNIPTKPTDDPHQQQSPFDQGSIWKCQGTDQKANFLSFSSHTNPFFDATRNPLPPDHPHFRDDKKYSCRNDYANKWALQEQDQSYGHEILRLKSVQALKKKASPKIDKDIANLNRKIDALAPLVAQEKKERKVDMTDPLNQQLAHDQAQQAALSVYSYEIAFAGADFTAFFLQHCYIIA